MKIENQLTLCQCLLIVFILLFVWKSFEVREAQNEYKELFTQTNTTEEDLVYAEEEITYLNGQIKNLTKHVEDLEKKLNPKPFKPTLGLTAIQNRLCLAIATFTETNGEPTLARETMAWAIVNRAIDPRAKTKNSVYKSNICGVSAAKSQYSGMGPYLVDIEDVVWGNITEFTPQLAQKHPDEMKAWRDIWKISGQIIEGKLTRKTTATHFISFRGMKTNTFPSWLKYLMPVGTTTESGLHTLYRDYGYDRKTGEIVYFTKANPYNPKKHRP